MGDLVDRAERHGVRRDAIADETVFVSHETYTPARGGSAQAEIDALRTVFGPAADRMVVANTKGLTGHPMGVGIEDVVAVKALETGLVPPVPNFKEVDPGLGRLHLSTGGAYPVRYALRLAAGFGSQISMVLLRWTPVPDGRHRAPSELGYEYRIVDRAAWQRWLAAITGTDDARLEVVQRRLRVTDTSAPAPRPVVTEAPPAPVVAETPVTDEVAERVLAVVAAKTGYPADVLERDLDLEADLGIDTVKQAEVFAQIREQFDIPRDDTLKLRDYPTLDHVIGFVRERTATADNALATPADGEPPAASDEVADRVLAVVAEKTGYPGDVLELDLDLEADLGIDTVKQAEVFAQIREHFTIPRDDALKLRDYPTLAHVIGFVRERTTVAEKPSTGATTDSAVPKVKVVELPDTNGFPRRVPVATIRPPFDLCLPTGITLGADTRVVVASDRGGVAEALAARLGELGVMVSTVDPGDDVEPQLGDGPVHGVYWLPALDHEGAITDMDLAAWREANRVRVKSLYATMRARYDADFLVTATRLGGRHGYDDAGAHAPLGGAVTGFAKAFARERPDALVKAVDVGPDATPTDIAEWLIAETTHDPGAVEVGHADGLRWTVTVEERDATGEPMTLDKDTVFVVTGAAGSIVSAITADLAAASGGTFHLLDLTPEPDPGDQDVTRFGEDREGLKADLIKRLRKGGKRPTPVRVEKELARLERLAAARAVIEAVHKAGGQVHYHSVDLTDGDEVTRAVGDLDRVDVLVHAAGLDLSHTLPDKKPREYDLVFDVKADGWFNLVKAIPRIGATVAFCSVAGRFGNLGQTDYAAANDLLCKLASAQRDTRAVAIDWTAWAGIGMAARGSIPTFMAQAGVEMLPPAIGIPVVRRELTAGTRGELVVAGRLGMMVEERAGADPAAFPAAGPMVGRVVSHDIHSGLTVETTIDPAEQAFLHDHRIDGTPVLPGVMGIEAFTEVAALPLPGWRPVEVTGVEFLAPCKFYRDEPRTVTVTATYRRDGDDLVAHCRLTASRQLPNQPEPQVTTHFTGNVRLARVPVADMVAEAAPKGNGAGVGKQDIYGVYFHGPAFQVLDRAWLGDQGLVGLYANGLPVDHVPADRLEVSSPRLIELVFQTAGVWEIGHDGRFGLPRHVDRIVLHQELGAPHGRVAARVTTSDGGFGAQVVDENGVVLLELSGYHTVELPGGVDPDRGAPLVAAMS
jgi:NAD(P)-dependent dehydrogenase (short-subunit alcohol dehydrogenase family)/acyl carrier protein